MDNLKLWYNGSKFIWKVYEDPFVKKTKFNLVEFVQSRLGFVLTLVAIYWLKTLWAYMIDFNLDTKGF